MSLTAQEAVAAVAGVIKTAWEASGAPTEDLTLLYDDVKGSKPGEDLKTLYPEGFGRVTTRILSSAQDTISTSRRYGTEALLTVQVFAPIGSGGSLARSYAQPLLNALRDYAGASSGLWFYNVAAPEFGEDGPWFRVDVVASYQFQEVSTA